MLVGTVYLFETMPTGFIPSQDSGFLFGVMPGPAGHFVRIHGRPRAGGAAISCAPIPKSPTWASFVTGAGSTRAFFFASMKPRDQRQHSVDQIIEAAAPASHAPFRASSPSCRIRRPSPSAGSSAPATYQLTLQSTNLDEIYTWAPRLMARMRQLPGLRRRAVRHADREPAADGGYRPRPRAGAGRYAGAGAGRALQRLRPARRSR